MFSASEYWELDLKAPGSIVRWSLTNKCLSQSKIQQTEEASLISHSQLNSQQAVKYVILLPLLHFGDESLSWGIWCFLSNQPAWWSSQNSFKPILSAVFTLASLAKLSIKTEIQSLSGKSCLDNVYKATLSQEIQIKIGLKTDFQNLFFKENTDKN